VAELVQHETEPSDESLTWREKKTAQLSQLANAPFDSKVVALGDKLSNMRGIAWDYRKVGDEVWKLFHAPNGKSDVEWYYRSLANALAELKETLAYQEFVNLLEEVFG
jgi:myo-inositol-1(or 4)-monophosphatase